MKSFERFNKKDPTFTTALRNAFSREFKVRFTELKKVIRQTVNERDCFGLKSKEVGSYQLNPPPISQAFAFLSDPKKIEAFMRWLHQQVEKGLLTVAEFQQIGSAIYDAWTNRYIADSYKRGIMRARYELNKAGITVPTIDDSGGIDAVFNTPFHLERVGILFVRVYSELTGITASMESVISQILAQGMIDGDGPALIARKLIAAIDGTGMGTLGITDRLGRFIPAQRRAMLLARTEIIRAHHLAMVQEYRNWGLEGITVLAEWATSEDNRVCSKCAALQGKIFTLDEIEPLIPLHPQCLIDMQVPIYTSEGWKPIGKIKIGDLVLTHKRRFRKVYALPRHQEKVDVITFRFRGCFQLSVTSNHPVLLEGNIWKNAGDCKVGDKVMILGNVCKRCGKPTPYFKKYCSRTCLSKDITDKQWVDPKHRKIVSEKNRISNLKQYASGERDRFAVTRKANERTQQMIKEGVHPFQREDVIEANKLITNLPKHRKASSKRMKENNPMHDPMVVKKAQKAMKEFYINNPNRRLNSLMAKHRKSNNMTYIEKKMSVLLDKIGIQYIYQYPILNYNVDFAIPVLKIVIECDGEYWHQDREKDRIRDNKIEQEGWFVLHYSGTKINQCLDEIEQELSRVLYNHLGKYDLVPCTIEKVKKWTLKRARVLYNLSVEDDESYIAKGVVVHNCRCVILPYIEELKQYYK